MNSHTDTRQQRRSLLSTSLAGEKNINASTLHLQQQHQPEMHSPHLPYQLQQPQKYQSISQEHPMLRINEVVNEEEANNIRYMEHPEPQLLASSVGKDLDGKLIPSSSTISLLSLNQDISSKYNEQQQLHQLSILMPKTSRTTSYSNLQRLQPYQRATTMSPPIHQQQQQPQQAQPLNLSSPDSIGFQPLAIPSTYNNAAVLLSTPGTVPNSPNLDPVSLGGSPSRFWLSSQTPPSSSANILKTGANQQTLLQLQHSKPQYIVYKAGSGAMYKAVKGDDSPVLNPVQTPIEDPPMTPLFLSNTNSAKHVDYFNHYHPNHSDLKEEDLEEEEGEEDPMGEEFQGKKTLGENVILARNIYS